MNKRILAGLGAVLAALLLIGGLPTRVAGQGAATAAATMAATMSATTQAASDNVTIYTLPDTPLGALQNSVLKGSVANDRQIMLGGMGSDLYHVPTDKPDEFWMVTDRGPNGSVKVGDETHRTFPVAEFDPMIVHVQTADGVIKILDVLPILTASGKAVTGVSNLDKHDEAPYDFSGQNRIDFNPNGLDPEGLVRTSQGDFWLCEEYAPSLVHIDKTGKVIKRYVPAGLSYTGADYPISATLPAIFAKRKANRGFEGLALSPDEKTLYAIIQSAMYNPDMATGEASLYTRIIAFDIAGDKMAAEYAYQFADAKTFGGTKNKPGDMKSSAMVALNATTLLVEERTDVIAKVYAADLSKATNILGTAWDDEKTTPSLEALPDASASGVIVPAKTLLIDLSPIKGIPGKVEGLAIVDKNTIAISNDNDFQVGDFDASGNLKPTGIKNLLLVIKLDKPLP